MTVLARHSEIPRPSLRLIPIDVATLRPLAQLDFDLYVQGESSLGPILFRQRDYPLSQEDIDRLVQRHLDNLFITELGQLKYQQYLENHLSAFLENERTPLPVRYRFLEDTATGMLQSAFAVLNVERAVEIATRLGRDIMRLVIGRRLAPLDIYRMARHDAQVFTHLVSVASYSIVLAERLRVQGTQDLVQLATGALLHDFGMRRIPQTLLNKETGLTPHERDLINHHPQSGFEELRDRNELSWGQLMMIYQHHERCDGSGFPVRVVGDEIHWMARLCAVADTFDTMTQPWRGRRPHRTFDVMKFLKAGAGAQFDREMVQCWTK